MNLDKYTQKSQEALLAAQRLAQEYQHQVVEPIHLLLALVQQEDGIVPAIITKVSGGTQAIQQELRNGNIPIAVVATAGTTDFGSIDPLTAIGHMATRYNLWFHIDAANLRGHLDIVEPNLDCLGCSFIPIDLDSGSVRVRRRWWRRG